MGYEADFEVEKLIPHRSHSTSSEKDKVHTFSLWSTDVEINVPSWNTLIPLKIIKKQKLLKYSPKGFVIQGSEVP